MPVYTVHGPLPRGAETRPAADRFVFVRDGFAFWAFVGGFLWLVYHRLWLALLGYVLLTIASSIALSLLHASGGTRLAVMAVVALLMGLEATNLRRWTLSRRKWRQLDVVVADDEEAAERRFFDRWTSRQRLLEDGSSSVDRGAPPPTRDIPGQAFSRPPADPHNDIIGLFPQPGMPR